MRRFHRLTVRAEFKPRQVFFGFVLGRTSYVMAWPFLLTVEI